MISTSTCDNQQCDIIIVNKTKLRKWWKTKMIEKKE